MKKDHAVRFLKRDFLILALLILLGFGARLYKITTPLADLHSWRQADTAAVGRNFAREGFDLLHPRYDDLSTIATGRENPEGYRMVEFPLYNALFAFFYKLFPQLPIEVWGRLTSTFFSLSIIAFIYYFTYKEANRFSAAAAALLYAIFPFFVFFSRVILPETTALAFAMAALFFLYLFSNETRKRMRVIHYILSAVLFAVGVLVKPTVIFYLIAALFLFYRRYDWQLLQKLPVYLYLAIAVAPFLLWRYHISFYPEGIPSSVWLFTDVLTFEGARNIFFRPAFFRWIFFERINNYMLGGFLTGFFLLGIFVRSRKYFLHALLISAFSFLFIFQGGNVQHEYYQTILLPAIAIFTGLGISFRLSRRKHIITPVVAYPLAVIIIILSFYFSFYKVRDYYNYPEELKRIGDIVQSLTNEDDKIVTDRSGDTTLLYLSDRKGSPGLYQDLEEFKKDGYAYFVTLKKEDIEEEKARGIYPLLFEEKEKFAIFRL